MKQWLKWFYFMGLIAFLIGSCTQSSQLSSFDASSFSSLPKWEDDRSTIPDDQFFYVNVVRNDDFNALIHAFEGGLNTDCKIPKEQSSSNDLLCILDIMEGDMWFHDTQIEYNIPEGMCEYFALKTHWHWNQRTGHGPRKVYSCNQATTEGTQRYCTRSCTKGASHTECVDIYDTCASECTSGDTEDVNQCRRACEDERDECAAECAIDIDDTYAEISELCEYDTTDNHEDGTNCCLGKYTLESPSGDVGDPTDWGGNVGECIGGLGRVNWDHHDDDGYPIGVVTRVPAAGYVNTYQIPMIESFYAGNIAGNPGLTYTNSLDVANFYTGIENLDFHPFGGSPNPDRPDIYKHTPTFPNNHPPTILPSGEPYMRFTCLDTAHEVRHQILLVVREWNSRAEFIDFHDSDGRQGDPDVEGTEGSDCDYYEPSESNQFTDCNDVIDVDDLEDLLPSPHGGKYPHTLYK